VSIAFSNTSLERAVLAGLCQYGNQTYFDVVDLLQPSTFTDEINTLIYQCISHIIEDTTTSQVELASLLAIAEQLGLQILQKPSNIKYIKTLYQLPINIENVRRFAAQIRKLEVSKLLHQQLGSAQDKLTEIKGNESITQILSIAEDAIFDFTSLLHDTEKDITPVGKDLVDYVNYLSNNPVEQVGLSTNFPAYDQTIGGGLRPATVNIIGSRSGVGKSTLGQNMGYHIASQLNIPVLFLDTEMTKEDHIHRLLAMINQINIFNIETGKFGKSPELKLQVTKSAEQLKSVPYFHESISGKPFEDQIALMRRWLIKSVGFQNKNIAKNCLIVYDYLKLMNTNDLSKDLKEYQVLGFMMTTLHNFAVRYNIPILAFIQLNRDGIGKESTDVISGSDRVVWLCSNLTIFKDKSEDEIAADGVKAGNKKMVVLKSRHGPGTSFGDYISCTMKGEHARITEGKTKFELLHQETVDDLCVPKDLECPI